MKYRFTTCDVFTEERFGGNPLAVLPEASGLSPAQMQRIAREFNFSETSFVFPAQAGHTRQVRIFTPAREIPFAGHPNVGTAFVLAATGELGALSSSLDVTFEEEAGLVSISVQVEAGRVTLCELQAPQRVSLGKTLPAHEIASALSLREEDIRATAHPPRVVSVGLPFVMTELTDRAALERARPDLRAIEALGAEGVRPSLYLYTRATDGYDVRARMFAPMSGVPEDPATGSAACALAGLLAQVSEPANANPRYRIAQGVEMGRPSTLIARAAKTGGEVRATWVGGSSVLVSEGVIHAD